MKLKEFFGRRNRTEVDLENLPVHIGIIMDGNGRWAKRRGLPRTAGHAAGAKTFEKIVEYAGNMGIKIVTVYAFSTENWRRPKEEIDMLMSLLEDYLDNGLTRLAGRDVKIHFIGDESAFSEDFQRKLRHMEKATENNGGLLLNVALNYGGRREITLAVRKIAKLCAEGKLSAEDIDEKTIENYLDTSGQHDPDLIIRPSGDYRLSNFLLWQSAYSELWFDNVLWPDFSENDLRRAVHDYQRRSRRFGGV